MNLKLLREHYTKRDGTPVWVPKMAFNNSDEIKEQLGFDLEMCKIYRCSICEMLHISTKWY